MLGDSIFSKDSIAKMLAVESPHAKILQGHEKFFSEIVRGVNPKLKELRRLVYNQTRIKDATHIMAKELEIKELMAQISKILAPYQVLGTMVHQEQPGTIIDQEVNNPQRFVNRLDASLWVIVKMISEMEVYLMAVEGVTKDMLTKNTKTNVSTKLEFVYEDRSYTFPEAVARFSGDTVLASAGEVAQFKQETNNSEYFISRTACLYFTEKGTQYVVFNDDIDDNILLSNARAGYLMHVE
jgi:hypothetical protein